MERQCPGWLTAACGVVYIALFFLLPVYDVMGPIRGAALLSQAPVAVVLLLCGAAMAVSALVANARVSLCLGAVCTVGTLVFGLMGNVVVPSQVRTVVPVTMGYGILAMIAVSIVFCAMESRSVFVRNIDSCPDAAQDPDFVIPSDDSFDF